MTKNPRPKAGAGASLSIAADNETPTRNRSNLQPLEGVELARYQAMTLAHRLALRPEIAHVLATLAFAAVRP